MVSSATLKPQPNMTYIQVQIHAQIHLKHGPDQALGGPSLGQPNKKTLGPVLCPLADNSKDYMMLGCFPNTQYDLIEDDLSSPQAQELAALEREGTGMSVDRCAAMARAADPNATVFHIRDSWK
jgi:hypothetical protein